MGIRRLILFTLFLIPFLVSGQDYSKLDTAQSVSPNDIIAIDKGAKTYSARIARIAAALSSGVGSFNGRTGVVVPIVTDYNTYYYSITNPAKYLDSANSLVRSVFGRRGVVTAQTGDYTTTQVTEGVNLYHTLARARAAISVASGILSYNTATGILTTNILGPGLAGKATSGNGPVQRIAVGGGLYFSGDTLKADAATAGVNSFKGRNGDVVPAIGDYTTTQVTEGSNLYWTITRGRAAFSAASPLNFDPATGIFSMPAATTLVPGYLTTIDYNKFNNKENALTFGAPLLRTVNNITLGIVPTTLGGTGISTLGTAGQSYRVNAGATGVEWYTPSSGGGVTSVYGRTGLVAAQVGDYSDFYYLNSNPLNFISLSQSRAGQSVVGPFLNYNSSTGVLINTYTPENAANKNATGTMGNSNSAFPTEFTLRNYISSLNLSPGGSVTTEVDPKFTNEGVFAAGSYPNPSFITSLAWNKITNAPSFLTSFTEADPLAVKLAGSYVNPVFIQSLAWPKITGVPNFLTSYTETDPLAVKLAGAYTNPSFITSIPYTKITGMPAFITSYTETDPLAVKLATVYQNPAFIGSLPATKITGLPDFNSKYDASNPLNFISRSGISSASTYVTYNNATGVINTLYNPENGANKSTNLISPSNITYPTTQLLFDQLAQKQNIINMPSNSFIGRYTTGTGSPQFITLSSDFSIVNGVLVNTGTTGGGTAPEVFQLVVSLPMYFTNGTPSIMYAQNGTTVLLSEQGDTLYGENASTGRYVGIRESSLNNRGTMSAKDFKTLDSLRKVVPVVPVSDGDKGDITVSATGTNWNIDGNTIGTTEIIDGSIQGLDLQNAGTAGTYNQVATDSKGRVISGSNVAYLTENQIITVTGDATGSGTTSMPLTLKNTGTAGEYNLITFDSKGREISGVKMPYLTRDSLNNGVVTVASPLQLSTGSGLQTDENGNPQTDEDGNLITDEGTGVLSIKNLSSTETGVISPAQFASKQDLISATLPLSLSGNAVQLTLPGALGNIFYKASANNFEVDNAFSYKNGYQRIGNEALTFEASRQNITSNDPEVFPFKYATSVEQTGLSRNIALFGGKKGSATDIVNNAGVIIINRDTITNNRTLLNFYNSGGLSGIVGVRNKRHTFGFQSGDMFLATTKDGVVSDGLIVKSEGGINIPKFSNGTYKVLMHNPVGDVIDSNIAIGGSGGGTTYTPAAFSNTGNVNGFNITGSTIGMNAATATTPGGLAIGNQTLPTGDKSLAQNGADPTTETGANYSYELKFPSSNYSNQYGLQRRDWSIRAGSDLSNGSRLDFMANGASYMKLDYSGNLTLGNATWPFSKVNAGVIKTDLLMGQSNDLRISGNINGADLVIPTHQLNYQNYVKIEGSGSGSPFISVDGTGTNLDLNINGKGTGSIILNSPLAPVQYTSTTRPVSPTQWTVIICTNCAATDGSTGVMQTYNGSAWKNAW